MTIPYGGTGKYRPPTAAMYFTILPWRYLKNVPVWLAAGIDCFGTWDRPPRWVYPARGVRLLYCEKPRIYAPGLVVSPDFFAVLDAGFDPARLNFKETPNEMLPTDFWVDVRKVEQISERCCPPQIEALMFEGVEMIG